MTIQPTSIDLSFLRSRLAQKRIAGATLVFALAGLAYALVAPKWYRSAITLVPAGQPKASVSGLLGAQLGGLASAFEGSSGADAARIAAVLQGTAVTDAVIAKFDLKKRYGETYLEVARSALWR